VVQTKWISDEAGTRELPAVASALKADSEDVRLMLKARLGTAPTRAVVAVCGKVVASLGKPGVLVEGFPEHADVIVVEPVQV
jgi:hypothetical protein